MIRDKKLIPSFENEDTFINSNRYLEYKHSQGKGSNLVHRRIAFKEIYLENSEDYSYDFEEYEVHHKNKDKLDNRPENLELKLPKIHYAKHFGTYQEQQERERQLRISEVLSKESSYPITERGLEQKSLEESIEPKKISFWEKFLKFFKRLLNIKH